MAIPAEITFAVSVDINPRDFRRAIGIAIMTLTAEFAIQRLLGSYKPGVNPVIAWNSMARGAIQGGVMGYHFLARYLPMASAAVIRRVRYHRIMRIVTGHASLSRIVQRRYNLGKPGRPRWIISVADRAKIAMPRGLRLELSRGFNMLRQGPMTDLA